MRRSMRCALPALALTLALGAPAAASAAAEVAPPGNSAVNQYTETFPTSHGNQPAPGAHHRSPQQVLGHRNARRLEAAGPEGRAAADLAAATAPSTARGGGGSGGHAAPRAGRRGGGAAAGGGGGAASGSSGLGNVIGQATGSSSGGHMGLFLPLVLLATLAWAVAYAWRRRGSAT